MTEERDPPIENPTFVFGVNVVDIGDIRVARGLTRRPHSACSHHRLMYDQNERRIWCRDCERDVESFDAFKLLVENYNGAISKLERREKTLAEAEQHKVRSLAAKNIDDAWCKRAMVPACPHCGMGLFPEDFKNGIRAKLSREYAEALARRHQEQKAKP